MDEQGKIYNRACDAGVEYHTVKLSLAKFTLSVRSKDEIDSSERQERK